MKPIALSGRLKAVSDMVTVGNRVCDVGCDHGFVPIYLIEQGISPRVLAMDVRSGPLNAAKEHVAEHGLRSVIETRLSDGLHNYNIDEADTLICAGMGGRLMMRILSDDRRKTESFRELILQPQSEIEQFRGWLRRQGYCITDENMIEEDGKFYPMMRVVINAERQDARACGYEEICKELGHRQSLGVTGKMPTLDNTCDLMDGEKLCKLIDRYGPYLLLYKSNTLKTYLEREERIYGEIADNLQMMGLSDEKRKNRYAEVMKLMGECRMALKIVTS